MPNPTYNLLNVTKQQGLKTILVAIAFSTLASYSSARLAAYWPYERLTKEADIIVIATPTRIEETGEKMNLLGITRDNKSVSGFGINTTFTVLAVLKGQKDLKSFVLFHLREADPQDNARNAPMLVSFDPKGKKRYLFFLKREEDGRFTSLCGQTDPAGAVKDLGTHP